MTRARRTVSERSGAVTRSRTWVMFGALIRLTEIAMSATSSRAFRGAATSRHADSAETSASTAIHDARIVKSPGTHRRRVACNVDGARDDDGLHAARIILLPDSRRHRRR